jgi:hypothetical protein
MNEEESVPDETEVEPEEALETAPAFGEQDEEKQADEWEEDAREDGE